MGGHKVSSENVSRIFFFFNIANKVLSWNYFHFVLTKGIGKIHQLMQGCIMIKTKDINPSFILKRQYKSFFLYWPLMSFPPWIHLKHFSLMNGICYYEVSFVSSLASRTCSSSICMICYVQFSKSHCWSLQSVILFHLPSFYLEVLW